MVLAGRPSQATWGSWNILPILLSRGLRAFSSGCNMLVPVSPSYHPSPSPPFTLLLPALPCLLPLFPPGLLLPACLGNRLACLFCHPSVQLSSRCCPTDCSHATFTTCTSASPPHRPFTHYTARRAEEYHFTTTWFEPVHEQDAVSRGCACLPMGPYLPVVCARKNARRDMLSSPVSLRTISAWRIFAYRIAGQLPAHHHTFTSTCHI